MFEKEKKKKRHTCFCWLKRYPCQVFKSSCVSISSNCKIGVKVMKRAQRKRVKALVGIGSVFRKKLSSFAPLLTQQSDVPATQTRLQSIVSRSFSIPHAHKLYTHRSIIVSVDLTIYLRSSLARGKSSTARKGGHPERT